MSRISITIEFSTFTSGVVTLEYAGPPSKHMEQNLSEQMDRPLEQIPHNYGECCDYLKN